MKALSAVGGKIAYQFGHMRLNLGKKRNAAALGQEDPAPTAEEPAKGPPAKRALSQKSAEKKRKVDPKQGQPSEGCGPRPVPSTQEPKKAPTATRPSGKPTGGKKATKSEDCSPSGRRQTRQGARANTRQTLITASYRKDAR